MITRFFEIPLESRPMNFIVRDSISRTYRFLTQYRETEEGGWLLDIDDNNTGEKLVYGIPLVSGLDLLWQFNYLKIRFNLLMNCRGGRTTPTFESLGTEDRLIAVYHDADPERPTPLEIILTKIPMYAIELSTSPFESGSVEGGQSLGFLLSLTKAG